MGRFCLLLIAAFLCCSPAKAKHLLSPAVFFADPDFRLLQVSPSGRYIAAVRDMPYDISSLLEEEDEKTKRERERTLSFVGETGGDQLVIYDLDEKKFVKAYDFADNTLYWLHWATDDRLLISLSATYDLKYGSRFTIELPAARTMSLNWRTKDTVVLFAEDRAVNRQNLILAHITDPLPDDPDHVLMPAYKRGDLDLWKVNIITGESERIEAGTERTFGWITDGAGGAAFRLDQNWSGTVMRVYAKKPTGGWSKILSTHMNEKGEAPEFQPIAQGARQNEMYVLATPKDEQTAKIKIYDLNSGDFSATAAEDDKFDFGGGLIDPNTGEYLGAWMIDDRYRMVLRDKDMQKHIDAVNAFFDNDANVRLIAISRNQSRLIFDVSSPTIPEDVYVYDYDKRYIDPLFAGRPELGESNLGKGEIIHYKTRDGLEITGYLTNPPGLAPNAPAPLVVMPHGGPAARDYYEYDPFAQFLASRGYRVFQPNFRGSSGYGRVFREAGYGEWGGAMQNDLTDGVMYLKKRGLIEDRKVCIVGASYGGYAALYAAMTSPDIYACAVSMAGVTDLIDIVKYARDKTYGGEDAYDFAVRQIGHPKRDADKLISLSPARQAARISIPLLIIHGTQDRIVPYEQAKKLMDALDEAKVPYEKYIVKDGHSFEKKASTIQSMRRIEAFLAEHLGGASDSPVTFHRPQ